MKGIDERGVRSVDVASQEMGAKYRCTSWMTISVTWASSWGMAGRPPFKRHQHGTDLKATCKDTREKTLLLIPDPTNSKTVQIPTAQLPIYAPAMGWPAAGRRGDGRGPGDCSDCGDESAWTCLTCGLPPPPTGQAAAIGIATGGEQKLRERPAGGIEGKGGRRKFRGRTVGGFYGSIWAWGGLINYY